MIAFAKGGLGGSPLFPRNYFELPDAVSLDSSRDALRSGYTLANEIALDCTFQAEVPLIVAQSKERILSTLHQLVGFIGRIDPEVQFFVDTFIQEDHNARRSVWTPSIPPLKLINTLRHYEDLLLNDGYHAYAIAAPTTGVEIQLDDHKLILIYTASEHVRAELMAFLEDRGLTFDPTLPLITEKDHHHHTKAHHQSALEQLVKQLALSPTDDDDTHGF